MTYTYEELFGEKDKPVSEETGYADEETYRFIKDIIDNIDIVKCGARNCSALRLNKR